MAGEYLTPTLVAERWSCSARHVRRLAETGRLRGMRVGELWRFSLGAVEAYEQQQTAAPSDVVVAGGVRSRREAQTPSERITLPDGYEPVFPSLWGMDTPTKSASRG